MRVELTAAIAYGADTGELSEVVRTTVTDAVRQMLGLEVDRVDPARRGRLRDGDRAVSPTDGAPADDELARLAAAAATAVPGMIRLQPGLRHLAGRAAHALFTGEGPMTTTRTSVASAWTGHRTHTSRCASWRPRRPRRA